MDFSLPGHVEALREEVRKVAEREIRPHVQAWDEGRTFPREALRTLGALGLMGIMVPEDLGGPGLGALEYAVAVEEVSRVDGSLGIALAAHNGLCLGHLLAMGSPAQQARWVPALASGEALGAWALTEPEAGSDAGALRTVARREAGRWVLNGTKNFCTHGTEGDVLVVMARTRAGHGADGISAFVLEKGDRGFRPGKQENKLGLRASDTSELILEDVVLDDDRLLGEEGVGFRQAMRTLDGGRIGIAALALGMAQGALEEALRHARTRRTFGKALADHQAIQFKLADMQMAVEASRLLVHKAAWLRDTGHPYGMAASLAKLHASEAAVRVAEEALQIHGGYGYIKDYPVEKFYRDVKLCTIGEGSSEIQRMVIARHLLQGAP